ncbi:hypothetical protein HQQ92_03980 [Shewanella sp. DC2-4]|uniref:hypothetical protein n=1 Tax=Shewanella sp. DC2-4 TaxID=2739431 RepID=UPI0015650099|nr:hypothetical protein [Shewanella sp. DC2-4]NRD30972.1 hypothetical protein [Shewanella sp. DC2-4]
MNTPKIKAFQVQEHCEGAACIVFHQHAAAARRIGAGELNLTFEDDMSVTRCPEYDQYAEQGNVPYQVLLADGWCFTCYQCGNPIKAEDDEGNATDIEAVICIGEAFYCSKACHSHKQADIAQHNAKAEAFKQQLLSLRPDLTFTAFNGAYPQLYCIATFTFEGAQYGGSVAYDKAGELDWRVSNTDLPAWQTYQAQRQGEAA